MPNSAARSTEFFAGERIKLVRGGGALVVSGAIEGLREWSTARSGRVPGADGVRRGASFGNDGLGKVSDRFSEPKGCEL